MNEMSSCSRSSIFSSMQSMCPTWYTLLLCITLLCGVSHGVLIDLEKGALVELLSAFPNLGSIPTSEYVKDDHVDYGRAWTNNFDNLCISGDGYEYYGLYCSNGHISGIVLTEAWEMHGNLSFSRIDGLIFLTNVTTTTLVSSSSLSNLLVAIVKRLKIVYLESGTGPVSFTFMNGSFGYPTGLRGLRGAFNHNFDLTPFGSLRSLDLVMPTSPTAANYGTWPRSLASLSISGSALPLADLFELVANSRNLKSLTIRYIGYGNGTLVSESLETVDFSLIPSASITFNSSSLKTLVFNADEIPLALNTPNLRKLTIAIRDRVPIGFKELYHLEELTLLNTNVSAFGIINTGFAVNLTRLSLDQSIVEPSELSSMLCQVVANHPKLRSLQISKVKASLPGAIFELPPCLKNASQLRSLYLSTDSAVASSFGANFVDALPPFLGNLTAIFPLDNDTNIYNLTQFKHLNELHLSSDRFVGELKNDFFSLLPKLEPLSITSNRVNGTIPSVGWANLRSVEFVCQVNQWTGLDAAPYLKHLHIRSDALETIPNDVYLESLRELEYFDFRSSQSVSIPTPLFWTRLPKLESFIITYSNLSGPITTSIAAPRLIWLTLGLTGICGPLPDFEIPMTLNYLFLDMNRFSGTIPPSWAANLSIRSSISLDYNLLNGTVPSGFLNSRIIPYMRSITLRNNYFTGPLWNLSRNYPADLVLSGNSFNICDNLNLSSTASISTCTLMDVSMCPTYSQECSTLWLDICTSSTCSTQSVLRTVPPIQECIAPPAVVPLVYIPIPPMGNQCPPPRPPGFECINGQWISTGSVTIPAITLPPNGGAIIVNGNLSANGSLTFDGIGTSIVVEGCVDNAPTEIAVVIKGDEKLTPTTLISQKGTNCAIDLSSIPVNLVQDKNNCKQVKLSTKQSTRSSLVAIFEIDSHKCNTKWIILGSVLGGFFILVAVGITVLYHLSPRFRTVVHSCTLKKVQ